MEDLLSRNLPVIVVDDGSGPEALAELRRLSDMATFHRLFRDNNGGKGAAVQDGFDHALSHGFTHALQVDADGQHDLSDVSTFIEASRRHPSALICGRPLFDSSAPTGRVIGRKISIFWCAVETLGLKIHDPLCGFRVYPLGACAKVGRVGCRMEFDSDIAVRLVWGGTSVVNLKTRVLYLSPHEGGVSHFRMFRDNLRICWLHSRLVTLGLMLLVSWPLRHLWSALAAKK